MMRAVGHVRANHLPLVNFPWVNPRLKPGDHKSLTIPAKEALGTGRTPPHPLIGEKPSSSS